MYNKSHYIPTTQNNRQNLDADDAADGDDDDDDGQEIIRIEKETVLMEVSLFYDSFFRSLFIVAVRPESILFRFRWFFVASSRVLISVGLFLLRCLRWLCHDVNYMSNDYIKNVSKLNIVWNAIVEIWNGGEETESMPEWWQDDADKTLKFSIKV